MLSGIKKLTNIIGSLAACMLVVLVLIISYNVVARYLFSSSSLGLEELSWHLYAAIFLLGMPLALQSNSHVRVDLFYEHFSPKTKAIIDLVGTAIFLIPTCLIIIWAGWHFTLSAYQLGTQPDSVSNFFNQLVSTGIGERSQDPGGLLNRWIIKGVIPLSFFFLLLSSIVLFFEKVEQFKNHDKGDTA